MTAIGPLEQLELLDQQLHDSLAGHWSLPAFVQKRIAHALPKRDTTTLRIGALTLPEAVIAQLEGDLDPTAPVTAVDGVTLATADVRQVLKTVRELGSHLPFTAVDHVVGFWKTGRWPGTALPALEGLEQQLAQRWQAQMQLRRQDQTLDEHSELLMKRALDRNAQSPWVMQMGVKAKAPAEIVLLPGVFVVGDADDSPVLLHSLAYGLECFATLAGLKREFSERLDDPRQGAALLSPLTAAQLRAAYQAETLEMQPINGSLLSTIARSVRDWHLLHLREAWRQRPPKADLAGLAQHLNNAAWLPGLLNRRGPLQTRYALLLARHMLPWFKNTDPARKVSAIQAIRELILAMALARSPALPSAYRFGQRDKLLTYAAGHLRQRIMIELGLDVDPLSVMISTTRAVRTGPLLHPLQPSTYIVGQLRDKTGEILTLITHRRSLAVLALENVSLLDLDFALTARVSVNGAPGPRSLTPSVVKTLVRRLSVGSSYKNFLEQRLLRDTDAQWRRERYRHLALARMRYEAFKSLATKGFLPDTDQHGFRSVHTLLDHPRQRERDALAGAKRVRVHQLLINQSTISGVLVVTAIGAQTPDHVVVYTPAAPDRRTWREYTSRWQFLKAFIDNPLLVGYLVSRASLAAQARVRNVLASAAPGSQVRLEAIPGDFIEQCYDAEVRHTLADISAQANSTSRLDTITFTQAGLAVLELMASMAPTPAPLIVALARALTTLWDGLDALPDRDTALLHFMSSVTYLGDAGISLAGSPTFARAFRNLPLHSPSVLRSAMAVPREGAQLRYRIDGIYREGVYETLGEDGAAAEYLIEDRAGRRYKIEFDGEDWNIIDVRHPEASTPPRVRKNAAGDYEIVSDLYWKGAQPNLTRLLDEAKAVPVPAGLSVDRRGLATAQGRIWLRAGAEVYELRKSLVSGRYRMLLPQSEGINYPASVLLRRDDDDTRWLIQVRQTGVSSDWLALP